MERDREPVFHLFRRPLLAVDLYETGTECHAVPVSLIPIIAGALQELRQHYAWVGSDADVALALEQIGSFIGLFGSRFTLCTCPEGDGQQRAPSYPVGLETLGDDCMSNCSIPYGALRWQDGVLQYLYCGTWYDVPGAVPDDVALPPGDGFDFDDQITGALSKCGKATALADKLIDVAAYFWDNSDNSFYPLIERQAENSTGVDLKTTYAAELWALTMAHKGLRASSGNVVPLDRDNVLPEDMLESMACLLEPYMSDSMFEADGDALDAKVANAIGTIIPAVDVDSVAAQAWWYVVKAMVGKAKMLELANAGAYDTSSTCDCGTITGPPLIGSVKFDGTYQLDFATSGAIAIEEMWVTDGGKACFVQFATSPSTPSLELRVKLGIDNAVAGTLMKIRQYPVNGRLELPTTNWQTSQPITNSTLWREATWSITTDFTQNNLDGPGYIENEIAVNTNTNAIQHVVAGGKANPQTGMVGGNRYVFCVEIVSVGSTAYPTQNYTAKEGTAMVAV